MTSVTVFDAYGTLFDPHALAGRLEAAFPGRGAAVSASWRDAQLRYTWLRSMMGRWAPFDAVTVDALRWAGEVHGVEVDPSFVDELMAAYHALPTYPDVLPALGAMDGRLAVLSNGSLAMLEAACARTPVRGRFEAVLSSDDVRVYKPHPRMYQLVPDRLGVPPAEVRFVSGNGWDCAGAAAFGFEVVRVARRSEPPERLGARPARTIIDLGELLDHGKGPAG